MSNEIIRIGNIASKNKQIDTVMYAINKENHISYHKLILEILDIKTTIHIKLLFLTRKKIVLIEQVLMI